jgi:hypothetical protein
MKQSRHLFIVTEYRREVFNAGIFAYFNIKLAKLTEHYLLIRFKEVNHDNKMVEEKNKQELLIQGQFVAAFDNNGSDSPAVQLEKVQKTLALIMTERKLNSIPEGPFDTYTISQFSVFLL